MNGNIKKKILFTLVFLSYNLLETIKKPRHKMNITAQNYLDLVGSETQNISNLFTGSIYNSWTVGAHCATIYLDSRAMLKNIVQIVKESDQLFDDDLSFVSQLERIQEKTKAIYHEMGHGLFLCRFLLKKTINHYSSMISAIAQHDALVLGIPTTELPIDELMDVLNKPKNKAMLEQSIAELKAGKSAHHHLIHE